MTIPVYVPGITINDNGNLVLDAAEMDAAGVGVVEFIEGTPEARIAELEARLKEAEALRISYLMRAEKAEARAEAAERELAEARERHHNAANYYQANMSNAENRAESAEAERDKANALKEAARGEWDHMKGIAEKAVADAGRLKEANTRMHEANTRMHEDIEALENVADLRRIALEKVEYHQAYTLSCPWCFSLQESGHKPDCARQAALSPAEQPAPRDVSGEVKG